MILYKYYIRFCHIMYTIVWMDGWIDGWMDGWMYGWMYMYTYVYIYMLLSARVTAHSPMLRQNHVQPVQPGLKLGGFAAITAASFTERT